MVVVDNLDLATFLSDPVIVSVVLERVEHSASQSVGTQAAAAAPCK